MPTIFFKLFHDYQIRSITFFTVKIDEYRRISTNSINSSWSARIVGIESSNVKLSNETRFAEIFFLSMNDLC